MFTTRSRGSLVGIFVYCLFLLAAFLPVAEPALCSFAAASQTGFGNSEEKPRPAVRHFRGAIARAQPLLMRYGYWAAASAVLAEGIGIPMPGQTLLIAGGIEAAGGRMNIAWLLLLVAASAILGNSLGYAIGYWGGRFVLNQFKVNPQRQQYLENLFMRRGGFVILFGRFVDGLRQLNGIVSGIMKMPWWSFTSYNVAGALLWTATWGLGSYYLGRRIHFIAGFFHHHHALLFVLGLVALLALVFYLLRSTRRNEDVLA